MPMPAGQASASATPGPKRNLSGIEGIMATMNGISELAAKGWSVPLGRQTAVQRAAAEDASAPDWTDLVPICSKTPDETLAWGQGLSRPRLSDLSSTFANSQLLTAYSPSVDPLTTASSSLDPRALACSGAMSPASLDSDSPSPSLQGSPSLPLLDMPGSQSHSLSVIANQASAHSKIHMTLLSAPAAFGLPIGMHKPLTPPFTIHIHMVSEQPMRVRVKLVAFLLSAEQLRGIEDWNPHTHVNAETITNGQVEQVLLCTHPDTDGHMPGVCDYTCSENIVFKDMKFATSSRMRPRWLVFAMMLPDEDVLFVQYKVPTIVMSRPCDQLLQARSMLSGTYPTIKRARTANADDIPPFAPLSPPRSSPDLQPMKEDPGSPAVEAFRLASAPGNMGSGFQRADFVTPQAMLLMSSPMRHSLLPPAKRHRSENLDMAELRSPFPHRGVPCAAERLWSDSGTYCVDTWHAVLSQTYDSFNLRRPLTGDDVQVLKHVAGFYSPDLCADLPLEAHCLSAYQWTKFGTWFISQLRIMQSDQNVWAREDPTVICSFEVDRVAAQLYLHQHKPGTFLVRPSLSRNGCVVVSTVASAGGVKHLILEEDQLQLRSLEVWVRDAVEAETLLDYKTGLQWPKEQVFLPQYKRLGIVMDVQAARKHASFAAQHTADPKPRSADPMSRNTGPMSRSADPMFCSTDPMSCSAEPLFRSTSLQLPYAHLHNHLHGLAAPAGHHMAHPTTRSVSVQLPDASCDDGQHVYAQHASCDCEQHPHRYSQYASCDFEQHPHSQPSKHQSEDMLSQLLGLSPTVPDVARSMFDEIIEPDYETAQPISVHSPPSMTPMSHSKPLLGSPAMHGSPQVGTPQHGTHAQSFYDVGVPPQNVVKHETLLAGNHHLGCPQRDFAECGSPCRSQLAPMNGPATPQQTAPGRYSLFSSRLHPISHHHAQPLAAQNPVPTDLSLPSTPLDPMSLSSAQMHDVNEMLGIASPATNQLLELDSNMAEALFDEGISPDISLHDLFP